MREILFRGKRKDNGKWCYGSLQCFKGFSIFDNDYKSFFTVNSTTVGQYTGLTDKNGKRIFEGDILDCGDRAVYVKWHEQCGTWDCDFIRYKGELFSNGVRPVDWKFRAIVIGNIHDNPELLKEGAEE